MRQLKRYADAVIPMYDQHEDFDLQVRVRRMIRREKVEYNYGLLRTSETESERMIERRDTELEQNAGKFVIPDYVIQARRLAEMTKEARERYKQLVQDEEEEAEQFLVDTLRSYLEILPGQLEYEGTDGQMRELRTGEDLLAAYGGNESILREALAVIRRENEMNHAEKKRLQQLRAFGSGSGPRPEAASGTARETAVARAKKKDSAEPETAPAASKTKPSGAPVH
jgi:hypothetical protein